VNPVLRRRPRCALRRGPLSNSRAASSTLL
jgi:hypothetical protein